MRGPVFPLQAPVVGKGTPRLPHPDPPAEDVRASDEPRPRPGPSASPAAQRRVLGTGLRSARASGALSDSRSDTERDRGASK